MKGLPSQKDTGMAFLDIVRLAKRDLDTHLHTLQQLAAHIKLLIDAPENLWRLIERKKYFPATWLFLLVRVVHKTLVRVNEDEEGIWRRQGVDVLVSPELLIRRKGFDNWLLVRISSNSAPVGYRISISVPNNSQSDAILTRF